MSGIVNVRELRVGTRAVLASGAEVEIVENPGDGVWLVCRFPSHPDDADAAGTEEMIFAQDVMELRG